MEKKSRGKPRRWASGADVLNDFRLYLNDIVVNDYQRAPSWLDFSRWLAENDKTADVRTVYNAINEYFPTIKNEMEQMRADVITNGAMLGHYHATMSIFALKNWCGWTDKNETKQTGENTIKIVLPSEVDRYAD